jgi:hypothetical protein
MGILEMMAWFKNFLKSKDHRLSAAIGVAITCASLAAVGAVAAFMAFGGASAIPVLLTLGAASVAIEVSFKCSYDDNFKLGTCLGSVAATAGGLTLAFNAFFHKAPEQHRSIPSQPTALVQEFDKNAAGKNADAVAYYRVSRPGIPVTASPSAG